MPCADDRRAGCQQTFACGEKDSRLSLRDRQARPFSLRQDTAGHHASGGDLYIRKPPSLRNVRDPLPERGIEIDCQTVRFGCNPRTPPRKRTPGPAPARFLRWFSGSCGWGGSLGSEPDVSQIPQASPNVLTDPGPGRRPYHPSVNPGGRSLIRLFTAPRCMVLSATRPPIDRPPPKPPGMPAWVPN